MSEAPKEIVDPDPPPPAVEIGGIAYKLSQRFSQGDLCDLYDCDYIPPTPKPEDKPTREMTVWDFLTEPDEGDPVDAVSVLFKVVRSRLDNDLVRNEAEVLGQLYPADQKDEKYFRYLPKLYNSFSYSGNDGARTVNLLAKYDGFYSMSDVLGVYPKGLDYRDAVWMYKRLIVGLGYVHNRGFIHGAVLPTHVLVHPVQHGARIIDWSYAVKRSEGTKVKAISKAYRAFYAPEILARRVPTPATDIYMATACFLVMIGGDIETQKMPDEVPQPIQKFIRRCLLASPSARPDDAWKLHDELEELLKTTVGKPKYRPLVMSPTVKA
jgi:serine/threonine protein kinase